MRNINIAFLAKEYAEKIVAGTPKYTLLNAKKIFGRYYYLVLKFIDTFKFIENLEQKRVIGLSIIIDGYVEYLINTCKEFSASMNQFSSRVFEAIVNKSSLTMDVNKFIADERNKTIKAIGHWDTLMSMDPEAAYELEEITHDFKNTLIGHIETLNAIERINNIGVKK